MEHVATRPHDHSLRSKPFFPPMRLSRLVRLAILLLPVWWFLGLEQFIWPLLFFPMLVLLLFSRAREGRGILLPAPAKWGLLFLALQLLSSLFIVERSWYLVFVRNFALWLGGVSLFILTVNLFSFGSNDWFRLIRTVSLVTLFSCIASYLSVLKILDVKFVSPLVKVLPSVVVDSEFAQAILNKSWAALEATNIFGIWFDRPRSFFTYPNPFAGYLVLALPLLVYYASQQTGRLRRFLWFAFVALAGSTLIVTTSRAGIISCLGSIIFIRQRLKARWRFLVYVALVCALLIGVGFALEYALTPESLLKWGESFVTARGQSHLTRMTIYQATFKSWLERPLLGWGTQRTPTVAGLSSNYPPLGSHSTYVAILYRHGLVGFAVFVWMILMVIGRLYRRGISRPAQEFIYFARWAIIGNLLHVILLEVDLDATLLATMWLVWGLAFIATRPEPLPALTGEAKAVP